MSLLVQMIVFVTSVSWIISTTCLLFLRIKHPEQKAPFRTPGYPFTLILAYAGLLVMVSRLAPKAIIVGICWLACGIVLYFLFKKTKLNKYCVPQRNSATK